MRHDGRGRAVYIGRLHDLRRSVHVTAPSCFNMVWLIANRGLVALRFWTESGCRRRKRCDSTMERKLRTMWHSG